MSGYVCTMRVDAIFFIARLRGPPGPERTTNCEPSEFSGLFNSTDFLYTVNREIFVVKIFSYIGLCDYENKTRNIFYNEY